MHFKIVCIKKKSYCLKCKKDTGNIDPKVSGSSKKCGSKKSRFIKNHEAKGLSSKLAIKTP